MLSAIGFIVVFILAVRGLVAFIQDAERAKKG